MKRLLVISFLLASIVLGQTRQGIRNGYLQNNLDGNNFTITNLAAPINPGDVATKTYVDTVGGGGIGGGTTLGSLLLVSPADLFTNVTFDTSTSNVSGTLVKANAPANSIYGNPTGGSAAPVFMNQGQARTALLIDNVDNTSDASKPVSAPTFAAITSSLAAFMGSTNITTLGIITSGTWQGTLIANTYLPTLDSIRAPAAALSLANNKITNLADPSAALDAANKEYVDALASGGAPHPSVAAASTANLTLSGEQTIDGVVTSASRVLVKNQATASQNGIYVSAAGAWSRASDANTGATVGGNVFVPAGTANSGTQWGVTTPQPITLGTTSINYTLTGQTNLGGNTVDVTLGGQSYLTLSGQLITANPVDLSGANATGTLGAARFPALTGDVTTTAGSLATAIGTNKVTNTQLAQAPAGTIKGNNAGVTANEADLTPTQTKTVLSLNNVENTALSTWAGSTNITTLGTIATGSIPTSKLSGTIATGQIANSAATYAKIQNIAASRLLGNPAGIASAPLEISLGAGLAFVGSSLVASSTPPQIGTNATNTWTAGTYTFIEGTALSANRQRTLPLASGYVDGDQLKYFDVLTTLIFGPLFLPQGGDTIKGLNAAGWSSTAAGGYQPFTAAGYGGGSKSVTFQKKGTDWEVYALGGESLGIKSIQNSANPAGIATFDSSLLTAARSIAMQDGPLALMSPTDPFVPGVLRDIREDGIATKSPLNPTELVPREDTIGQAGVMVSGNSHVVTNDGTIDTVRIAGTLSGLYGIIWPSAANYFSGETVALLDASGSVKSTNPVTVTNGIDTFNGVSSFVFDEANGRKVFTSDGGTGWSIPAAKTSIQPFNILMAGGSNGKTYTVIGDTGVVKHNAHINLQNGVNTLAVTNPYDGMALELVLVQPSSGAAATLNLPIGSRVGANGLGLVSLSSTNSAIDRLRGSYDGTLGTFVWDAPILNHTSAALPSAPTSLSATGINANRVDLSWTDNATNETGFAIERAAGLSATTGFIQLPTTAAANATAYSDTSVASASPYTFRVRAFNAGGYSGYSNTSSLTTASGGPTADLWELHFNEGSGTSVGTTIPVGGGATMSIANWTTSTQSGSGAAFAPVTGMLSATGVAVSQQGTAGTTAYTYRVQAWKNSGTHNQGASQTTATGSAVLSSVNFNRITWNAVTGADYYEVYRTTSSGSPSSIGRLTGTGTGFTSLTFDDTGIATNGSAPSSGTTDVNTVTANSSVSYGSQVLSVSFWAKSSYTFSTVGNAIVNLGAGSGAVISSANLSKLQISFPGATGIVTGTVSNSVTRNGSAVNSGTTWHHVVVEMDNSNATNTGNEIKVYYDGLSTPETVTYTVTTRAGAATFATATPVIGSNGFAGAIDDVRIYNHALTTADINALFTGNAQ